MPADRLRLLFLASDNVMEKKKSLQRETIMLKRKINQRQPLPLPSKPPDSVNKYSGFTTQINVKRDRNRM